LNQVILRVMAEGIPSIARSFNQLSQITILIIAVFKKRTTIINFMRPGFSFTIAEFFI
jgi:hypothetical protein